MRKGFAPIVILAIVGISIIVGGIVYWQFNSKTLIKPTPNYGSSPSPKTIINPSATPNISSDEIVVKFEDSGKTIALKKGAKLKVVLDSTYWSFNKPTDDIILKQLYAPIYEPIKSQIPGMGLGTVTEEYQAISKGQTTVGASRNSCGEAMGCTGNSGKYLLNVVVN